MPLRALVTAVKYLVVAGLILFSLRRLVFSVTALLCAFFRRPVIVVAQALPKVTLLVAARDEERLIENTLAGISRLDYPRNLLEVVMVDDGSCDETPDIMRSYAKAHPNFRYHRVRKASGLGKAGALNEAIRMHGLGEIIYVLDADSVPSPRCVRAAVRHFTDTRVGAVGGAPFPSTNCSSLASYYSYLEQLVHQSVTVRAKDALSLAPGLFGSNFSCRRSALVTVGGFKDGALMEDGDLVLALYAHGYSIRFEPEAVSHLAMPRTVSSYFHQHSRWARGFNEVLASHWSEVLFSRHLPLRLRIELCTFAAGYIDRVLLIAGLALAAIDARHRSVLDFPRWVLAASLLSPLLTIVSALLVCHEPLARHRRLPLVPAFFLIDILAALKGTLDALVKRPRCWRRVDREPHVRAHSGEIE